MCVFSINTFNFHRICILTSLCISLSLLIFYLIFYQIFYLMPHCHTISFTSLIRLSFSSMSIFIMAILKSFSLKSDIYLLTLTVSVMYRSQFPVSVQASKFFVRKQTFFLYIGHLQFFQELIIPFIFLLYQSLTPKIHSIRL